ncbi:MAG: UDP-glucose/GDP-mannose dehydrogenase family protein [Planctomycetota bacterium]|nr:UDP-glucose/GDP-mannose dehydrogenase family protein [Planctomycetota bacterium]
MKICVIGAGYVGLVTATCLADIGNDCICVDKDERKIASLEKGEIPIYEPGLSELVERSRREGRLSFTTSLPDAVQASNVVFIAVGTPSLPNGGPDLSAIFSVAEEIAPAINSYKIIVMKSTVPPGTTERVSAAIAHLTKERFDAVSNPEFLKEGTAVDDFMMPDRVIIGAENGEAADVMKELYTPFVRTGRPIIVMDSKSAEMTKYVSNGLLATRISFINEMANLCERFGADVNQVRQGVGADSRIGYKFLFPGVGYGGSCFPKDVRALINAANELGCPVPILEAADSVNRNQPQILVTKILRHHNGDLSEKRLGIWGLSFKPKTDDMREAPSIPIIEELLKAGAKVHAYDPVAIDQAKHIFGERITYAATNYDAIDGADGLVLITEWNEFRRPDFDRIKKLLRTPVIFDGRNIYDPRQVREQGFTYYGIGV